MGTELTPSGRSLGLEMEFNGRPRDNGLYKQDSGQLFHYGKRILTDEGGSSKVFKYGHAKAAFYPGFLCANTFTVNKHITCAVLPIAIVANDNYATVTVAASLGDQSAGFGKDELVGGQIVVGHNNAMTGYAENRTISGNDAIGAGGGTIRVWVDGQFTSAHTTSDGVEVYPNPYAYLAGYPFNADYNAFMGVANAKTTIAYNSFIQTAGLCWINPSSTSSSVWGEAAGDRSVFAWYDGGVVDYTTVTTGSYSRQRVGFTVDTTSGAVTGMPLVMLTISY
jgi:hypothetical protein